MLRAAAAVPLTALALFAVSACGGHGSAAASDTGQISLVGGTAQSAGLSGDGQATPSAAPSAAASAAPPAKWVQLSTNDSAIGKTVTDVRGFTLYRFDKDKAKPSTTNCTGACAVTWPPVLVQPGGRVFVDGIDASEVSAIRRPDGGVQVTLGGWPVYFFAKDTVPGDVNGQGVGGTWFAIQKDGGKNTTLVTASAVKPADPDATKTLTAKQTGQGGIVVDDAGATLYTNAQACTDACAAQWRPVVASGGQLQVSGIATKRVGTVKRDDGTEQLTMDGTPLYRNAADKSTGVVITSAAAQGWNPAR